MSVTYIVDNGLVNIKITNQVGRKIFIYKGDLTLGSKEDYTLLVTDNNAKIIQLSKMFGLVKMPIFILFPL